MYVDSAKFLIRLSHVAAVNYINGRLKEGLKISSKTTTEGKVKPEISFFLYYHSFIQLMQQSKIGVLICCSSKSPFSSSETFHNMFTVVIWV